MSETERLTNTANNESEVNPEEDQIPPVSEREAYFQALRLWIQQAQLYQNFSTCLPYYIMTFQGMRNNASATNTPLLNNNYQIPGQPGFQIPNPVPGNAPVRPDRVVIPPAQVIAMNGGYEYVIPPVYKRILAEFIDFILLFVLKLIVTFMAVDLFEIIDLEKFDVFKLTENLEDFNFAMEFTSEILFLESIYRGFVCIFEAFCLSGTPGRTTGGATPGKALLGLRVINAAAIVPVEGRPRETVLLYPGTPLSFPIALFRSVLKNFLISLLFPLCFILFIFKYNRTGYDILCSVVVVEENMYPPRRHVP